MLVPRFLSTLQHKVVCIAIKIRLLSARAIGSANASLRNRFGIRRLHLQCCNKHRRRCTYIGSAAANQGSMHQRSVYSASCCRPAVCKRPRACLPACGCNQKGAQTQTPRIRSRSGHPVPHATRRHINDRSLCAFVRTTSVANIARVVGYNRAKTSAL